MSNKRTSKLLLAGVTAIALLASSAAAQRGAGDLREGAVYTMTNDRDGNAIVALARGQDGQLRRVGAFETGGKGSGTFEDTINGLVLGTPAGEAAPNNHIEQAGMLFATNARSHDITVFRVDADRLTRLSVTPSGGMKPVSVTVNRGVLYVLNSGEATDDLMDSEGKVIPNCTTGTPSITGFRVDGQGRLTPIPGSTRRLSERGGSGCAQISFSPDGRNLVVTERLAMDEGMPGPMGDEGVIDVFTRNPDGTLSPRPIVTKATGEGPFGFTFTKAGQLITTEQFDGPMGPGRGAAATYAVGTGGALRPTSASVKNGGTDSCWVVATDNGRWAYATSFFGGGRLSIYSLQEGLRLVKDDVDEAVTEGAADLSLSRDSRYLYQLNAFEGTINVFAVGEGGDLRRIQTVNATGASKMAGRIGLAAW